MKKRLIIASLLILILSMAGLAGCGSDGEEASEEQVFEVKRGDLLITVTVDGKLAMPREVELHFGTPGTVEQVLVEEGDMVTAGTVMAILDDTSKRINLWSAENSLQQTLSNLAVSISGTQQILGYPRLYPNMSALQVMEQAQREIVKARSFMKEGKYDAAALELRLALYDMSASIRVLEAPITDIENYPDIVRHMTNIEQYPGLRDYADDSYGAQGDRINNTIDMVAEEQAKLSDVLMMIEQGNYAGASTALSIAEKYLPGTVRAVETTVGLIIKRTWTFPDIAMGIVFLDSAKENIGKSQALIEQGDFDELEFIETLRMAYHDIEMSYSILSENELIVEHGLSLKEVQSNRLSLEKAIINLQNSREEYLKIVILAPFDGMVVDIGVSEDDQLSQQDYSSKAAVHLVDTSTVKFDGTVDEVDIFQVRVGQRANIFIDALPEANVTGAVTFISPAGSDESGVVNYTVTVELDPAEVELKGTLTATADIVIEESENVLLIPTNAINSASDGDFVQVVIDDAMTQTERRHVELGIRSYQFAEVVSGLEEGEKVLVSY